MIHAEIKFYGETKEIKEILDKITTEKKKKGMDLHRAAAEFISKVFAISSIEELNDTRIFFTQRDMWYMLDDFCDYVNGATLQDLAEKNKKRNMLKAVEQTEEKRRLY